MAFWVDEDQLWRRWNSNGTFGPEDEPEDGFEHQSVKEWLKIVCFRSWSDKKWVHLNLMAFWLHWNGARGFNIFLNVHLHIRDPYDSSKLSEAPAPLYADRPASEFQGFFDSADWAKSGEELDFFRGFCVLSWDLLGISVFWAFLWFWGHLCWSVCTYGCWPLVYEFLWPWPYFTSPTLTKHVQRIVFKVDASCIRLVVETMNNLRPFFSAGNWRARDYASEWLRMAAQHASSSTSCAAHWMIPNSRRIPTPISNPKVDYVIDPPEIKHGNWTSPRIKLEFFF